jgi:hypothetical protein
MNQTNSMRFLGHACLAFLLDTSFLEKFVQCKIETFTIMIKIYPKYVGYFPKVCDTSLVISTAHRCILSSTILILEGDTQ